MPETKITKEYLLHVADGQTDKINDWITASNYWGDTRTRKLSKNRDTFNFETFADKSYSEFLTDRNRIIRPLREGGYGEYIIDDSVQQMQSNGLHIYKVRCTASYLELKKQKVIYPYKTSSSQAKKHVIDILASTEWQEGIIAHTGNRTFNIEEHTNPYSFLKRIASEFNLELRFRIEHDGSRITGRYVDLLERVGSWRGYEIRFAKNLTGIERREKTTDIVTALLAVSPEDEDGNVKTALVQNNDALLRWGRKDSSGKRQHLTQIYKPQSDRENMTQAELEQYAQTELDKRTKAIIEYRTSHAALSQKIGHQAFLGDTVYVVDEKFNPPIYLEARVHTSIEKDKDQDIDFTLGDYIEYTEEEVQAIWQQLKKQIQTKISAAEMLEHTYDKMTIDNKDEVVFEEGKTFAQLQASNALKDAKADAKTKADAAEKAAEEYALAKANLAETQAKAHADGKVSAEEQARIDADTAKLAEAKSHAETKASEAQVAAEAYTRSQLTNYVDTTLYDNDMSAIQAQIDNQITSHFKDYTPSLTNLPASNWTTNAEKDKHIGDLFYNSSTGYSYRFMVDNTVYKWTLVRDEGIAKALQDAEQAQDTADSKRRVFIAQPTTPYDKGDLWDNNGAVYRSIVNKTTSATFSSADWTLIGDVTGENTSADTNKVGGTPSSDIETIQGASDKAGQALIDAQNYAVAQKVYDTKMTDIANDLADKAGIEYVDGELRKIEVGGRNLAPVTGASIVTYDLVSTTQGEIINNKTFKIYANPSNGVSILFGRTEVDIDEEYIINADMSDTISSYAGVVLYDKDENLLEEPDLLSGDLEYVISYRGYYVLSGSIVSLPLKFKVVDSRVRYARLRLGVYRGDSSTRDVLIKDPKFEKGNKATDWTPAPEDVQSDIDTKADASITYTIEEVDNALLNYVGVTEYTTDMDGVVQDLNSHSTRLGQNETAIGLKADASRVDTIEGTVSDHSAELVVMNDEISQKVEADYVSGAIADIEVGGRNFIINSHFENTDSRWKYWSPDYGSTFSDWGESGVEITRADHQYVGMYSPPISVEAGKEYTLTISGAYGSNMRNLDYIYVMHNEDPDHSSASNQSLNNVELPGSFQPKSVTFKSDYTSNNVRILIACKGDADTTLATYFVLDWVKLEKGNKATDWTPAPEDTQSQIDTLDVTISNHSTDITQNATAITSKAESSVVDTLTGRVSTAESTIDQHADQIQTKVDDGQARSIFTQEANSFTFDADQVNFTGHVFGTNATFTGDLQGASGTFGNVTVNNGDFNLKDETTSVKYSATPKRNILRDHSFELLNLIGRAPTASEVSHNFVEVEDTALYKVWEKRGNPKVAIQFGPDSADALPVFGSQALVVRNAHYMRQYVYEGVGAGSVYTVSAHFKRQWNLTAGIPRIEIWHVDAMANRSSKIVNSTFPSPPNDYSVARHATTFTVPSSFVAEDSLEIIVSGGDSNWVQCDGVQMVEDTKPSIYQPEDSIWEMTAGNYVPINKMRALWSGEAYPTASQTIYPDKPLFQCRNGWILEWSRHNKGDGLSNIQFDYTYIPKNITKGNSVSVIVAQSGATTLHKYLFFQNENLKGHADNDADLNHRAALRMVYEW